jgi:K+-sensing histidine kinase KdpD
MKHSEANAAGGSTGSVVCATNFTPAADRALVAALHLGRELEAPVVLVHVVRREAERAAALERLRGHATAHAPGIAVALLAEHGDVPHKLAQVARQQGARVLTIGRHRHSDALLHADMEDAIHDLAPCPVLEVAADEDPREAAARFLNPSLERQAAASALNGPGDGDRPCTVCGRRMQAIVCPDCGARITSELIGQKHQHERAEGRGLHPEDRTLGVNPLPPDRSGE